MDRLKRRLDRTKGNLADDRTDQLSRDFDGNIETGFQIATFQGPLCAEPVEGIAYFVERVDIDKDGVEKERRTYDSLLMTIFGKVLKFFLRRFLWPEQNRMTQVTGSLISAVKEACRNGLLDWSPRLMLAMYSCDIQASSECILLSQVFFLFILTDGFFDV